jgi:hypothetical protein
MHYKYNRYYSHGAPKIVRVFTTHSPTPLTHTTSFNISIQYNHNITAQTTNNTHKAVNQATKPIGSRPVTYRAVDIVMWYFPLQQSKVHFLLFSKKKSTFYFTRFLMWHSLEQLQQFLKILSTLSLYLHYQLLSIYFYFNSLLYFTLYSI